MPHTEIEEYGRDITALGVTEASDSKKKKKMDKCLKAKLVTNVALEISRTDS